MDNVSPIFLDDVVTREVSDLRTFFKGAHPLPSTPKKELDPPPQAEMFKTFSLIRGVLSIVFAFMHNQSSSVKA